MPFTERQRRFFHAAAERGEKGMSGLANEADGLAKEGKERPPVHVEKLESGGLVCRHCGGMVGEDGYATGDEAEEADERLDDNEDRAAETAQHRSTAHMREAAFVDAMRRRKND